MIWGLNEATNPVGTNGMCADIDATYPGLECHAADIDRERAYAQRWRFSATGRELSRERQGTMAQSVYWDADIQHELRRGGRIWDYGGGAHAVAVQGRTVAIADVVGDWREEVITSVAGELRIHSSAIAAARLRPTSADR